MGSYQVLDKIKFQHGLQLRENSICPRMDLLLLYNKQSTKLYRVNGSLIWERDLATRTFIWSSDGKFIVVHDFSNIVHILDVKDGSMFHQFKPHDRDDCNLGVYEIDNGARDRVSLDYLPTLGALPDISKSINQFLPFRLPKTDKSDADYIKTQRFEFPFIPTDTMSVGIHVREESLLDTSNYLVTCRIGGNILQLYLQGTLKLPDLPIPWACCDSLIISPQLDVLTLAHYGKITIPRDLSHLGSISSKLSITLNYAAEAVTRLTKLYADNGGPRSESIKWHDKIHEFVKPHSADTPEMALTKLLLMGTTSRGLREFIGENLTDRTLEKWTSTISSSLHQMQSLILYHIVPSLERTLILFEELHSTASAPGHYEGIPIDTSHLEGVIKITTNLTSRLWELTTMISKKVVNFNEFAKFLKHQMSKHAYYNQEEADEVVNMPKPDFDIMAVMEYLQSGFAMTDMDDALMRNDNPVVSDSSNTEPPKLEKVISQAHRNLNKASKLIEGKDSNDRRVSGSGLPIKGRQSQGRASEVPEQPKAQADVLSTITSITDQVRNSLQTAIGNCDVKLDLQPRAHPLVINKPYMKRERIPKRESNEDYHHIALTYKLTDEQKDSEIILLRSALRSDSQWQKQVLHLPTTRVLRFGYYDEETLVVLAYDRESNDHILASVPYHDLPYDGSRVVAPLDKQRTLSKSEEPVIGMALNGLPGRRISALLTNDGYGCLVFDMDGDEMDSDAEEEADQDVDVDEVKPEMRDFYDEKTQDIYRNTVPPSAPSRHSTQSSLGVGRQLVEGVLNLLGHSDSDDSDTSGSSTSSNFSFPRRRRKRTRKASVSSDSSNGSSDSSTSSPRRSISILSRSRSKKLKKRSRRSRLRAPDISQDFMLISLKSLHKPVIERHTQLSPLYRSIETTCKSDAADDGVWWLDIKSPTWDDMRSLCKIFPLHPLTQEDILQQDTREKLETFSGLGYTLIVFRGVDERYFRLSDPTSGLSRKADDVSLEHLSPDIHLNDAADDNMGKKRMRIVEGVGGKEGVEGVGVGGINVYLLIFEKGVVSFHFDNIATHTDRIIRRMFAEHSDVSLIAPEWIAHGLLDSLVDAFLPLIEYVEKETEEIDDLVVDPRGLAKRSNNPTNHEERRSEDTYVNSEKDKYDRSPDSMAYAKKFELPPPPTTPQRAHTKMGPLAPLLGGIMDGSQLSEWREKRKAKKAARERQEKIERYSTDSLSKSIIIDVPPTAPPSPPKLPSNKDEEGILTKLIKLSFFKNSGGKGPKSLIPEEIAFLSFFPTSQSHLLQRTTDTRRLVTGLGRLLSAKSDVIRQLRARMVEKRKTMVNPYQSEALREMIVHFGDIEDHVVSSTQTLMHDERVISSLHLAYLAQLKLGHAVSKSGSDNTILALSVITVCSLPLMVITQAFSMNVRTPRNGQPADPNDNGPPMINPDGSNPKYITFGCVVVGLVCVFLFVGLLVRYWIIQARKEGNERRRRRIGE
ncbi:hypothetical protein E3P99_02018 [Wallemia hederae]|uniref:Anaphase-promoting complex subunit 4 n=1 Tax=Wallemia hederae TaxID=1540922 RepID=A0A4T0FPV0_9BASI|nr:hypothetical protein E3P99_02018 [Wallemia hederae]